MSGGGARAVRYLYLNHGPMKVHREHEIRDQKLDKEKQIVWSQIPGLFIRLLENFDQGNQGLMHEASLPLAILHRPQIALLPGL